MDTKTVMYHTFGCKLNFAETATLQERFARRGMPVWDEAVSPSPDIIVINSCSVTHTADSKCRRFIMSLNRRYPGAAIMVTGCYAQLKAHEVAALPGVRVVAGNGHKDRLVDMALAMTGDSHSMFMTPAKDIDNFTPSCARGDRTRCFLKVQDGCDYWCSYCTIPRARGRSRSPLVADLVAQATQAARDGAREIVLTGVNIGDFGKGRDEKFIDLVKSLDRVDGIERYRISSIEPNLLTDEVIEFCATSRRFMPHFHVPLQSGDDNVLQLMRRRYDTAVFRGRIDAIRRAMPDAFIGVDLIVGARGETPERFESSCRFIESLDISRLHVFAYSERPGTRALEIEYKVSPAVQQQRVQHMLGVSARKLEGFASRFAGTVRPVLLEHPRHGQPMSGFTDNYLKVSVEAPAHLDNTIVDVRLDSYDAATETFAATLV